MDRRRFLAVVTSTTAGLFLPATGLVELPRRIVLEVAGECSFCRQTIAAPGAMAGAPGGWARICRACVELCLDILAEVQVPVAPTPPPRATAEEIDEDWRDNLAEAGLSAEAIDRMLRPPSRPRVARPLHCSFCDRSQHDVHKLIAGPLVFVCDGCVADAGALIVWSGVTT